MEQTQPICCPKCGSTQLTAQKKGFSGTKAVAGVLLTGGIGALAGTIGSNKIKLICLACGNEFKPGEISAEKKLEQIKEKSARIQEESARKSEELRQVREKAKELRRIYSSPEYINEALQRILTQGLVRGAVSHYRKVMKVSEAEAKEQVEKFIVENNLTNKVQRKGCFVATACYGNFNAPEVIAFRKYRDEKLSKTIAGRMFIFLYYLVSPPLANVIYKSDFLKKNTREILNAILSKINTSATKF